MKNKCNFVPYGEVESICLTCKYVVWGDESKSYKEIVEDMINVGYPKPICQE